ncbi:MAG TPA: YdeI/OmpD-associated family protein [Micromonosporaceae bacterium]
MGARQDPVLLFESSQSWEDWLEREHATSTGVWLKIAKKGAASPTVTYAEALDAALCFGWIDGQKNGSDDGYWLQRFTPRTPRSKWSKVNCDRVETLVNAGRMRPAGLREVERAKQDGRWDAAYDPQSTATVPDDLRHALDRDPEARAFFDTLDSRNRYAVLYRIQDAKRPETRQRRIETFVEMLHEHRTIYPIRRRSN